MSREFWHDLIKEIKQSGKATNEFADGLSDREIEHTESRFSFRFPPDLREFLQTALPKGERWPDWRCGDESALREWLDLPHEGILFDIEFNGFWLDEWGARPKGLADAKATATELIRAAPKLIPIYGHRMIPDEPHLAGNPVFSVHQTDIINYGSNLADYFRHEFHLQDRNPEPEDVRRIRFWDIDRFLNVRWESGSCIFDNRKKLLP
jgi:hypothetical protein